MKREAEASVFGFLELEKLASVYTERTFKVTYRQNQTQSDQSLFRAAVGIDSFLLLPFRQLIVSVTRGFPLEWKAEASAVRRPPVGDGKKDSLCRNL